MGDFDFSGPTCDRCGAFLDAEDAECDECDEADLRRYHFEHIHTEKVETAWAVNSYQAWGEVLERVENPIPWRCIETGDLSVVLAQRGTDVLAEYSQNT